MRTQLRTHLMMAAMAAGGLTACDNASSSPTMPVTTDSGSVDASGLVVDYGVTAVAAALDASSIGGSSFPAALALSTEQRAAIIDRQRSFDAANVAQIARLRGIEEELRVATRDHRPRTERETIAQRGRDVRAGLDSAFDRLRAEVGALYTPAQRDWVAVNRAPACRPGDGPNLTDEQIAAIRALQAAFDSESAELMRFIQQVVAEARAAAQAGATRAEIEAILARADEAKRQLALLEQRLRDAISGILCR